MGTTAPSENNPLNRSSHSGKGKALHAKVVSTFLPMIDCKMASFIETALHSLDVEDRQAAIDDIRVLLGVSEHCLDDCFDAVVDTIRARTRARAVEIESRLLDQSDEPSQKVRSAFSAAKFLVSKGLAAKTIDERVETHTLAELASALNDHAAERAGLVATRLIEAVAKVDPVVRRQRFARGVLPSIVGVGTTVELRAVQFDPFSPGNAVDEYQSQISQLVGVVSIGISTDSKASPEYYLQADAEELRNLIEILVSAEKDLAELTKSYKNLPAVDSEST